MLISYPLMAAIQEICARIGRVTGCGIAANLRKSYPKPLLYAVLIAVAMANIFNLGADIGAMGDALHLLVPGKVSVFVVGFGAVSLIAILFVPYSTYVKCLNSASGIGERFVGQASNSANAYCCSSEQ